MQFCIEVDLSGIPCNRYGIMIEYDHTIILTKLLDNISLDHKLDPIAFLTPAHIEVGKTFKHNNFDYKAVQHLGNSNWYVIKHNSYAIEFDFERFDEQQRTV